MLAKSLARELVRDSEDGFIRIDMTEFASKHEMARLIGSPPGYVGYEEGGQLTTKLAKCPEAVVLLDEVEKAHPDVLTLMLQVFDEGRLTDGKGQTISCPNAVFIMTSNLVQDEIREAIREGSYVLRPDAIPSAKQSAAAAGEQQQRDGGRQPAPSASSPSSPSSSAPVKIALPNTVETILPTPAVPELDPAAIALVAKSTDEFLRHAIHPILKRHFRREEFLGRINDIVVFHPLSDRDLSETVETELTRWRVKAFERHGVVLRWTARLVEALKGGYDERYGYRSIIYTVEKRVVNLLAASHERDLIGKGCLVELDVEDDPADAAGDKRAHQKVVIKKVEQLPPDDGGQQDGKKSGSWFNLF